MTATQKLEMTWLLAWALHLNQNTLAWWKATLYLGLLN